MAICDRRSLPVAIYVASASPGEVTLVEPTIHARFLADVPARLIGDLAYDSDPLDAQLLHQFGIDLIAPHKICTTSDPASDSGRLAATAGRPFVATRFHFEWRNQCAVWREGRTGGAPNWAVDRG
jgi:hypothetical protein